MRKLFYPRLAVNNIRKNGRFYIPYLLTGVCTIAMFYVMCMISTNDGIKKMPGAGSLSSILFFGTVVVGIFAAIFLFYTNSFLMKRRKKEIGLYNILGMEKRHIAKILFFETVVTGIGTVIVGLFCGILLSKLIFMLLFRLLRFSVPMGFTISETSLIISSILFCGIFLLTLLSNLVQIKLAKPIELLKGGNTGEREPKSKWVLTVIGLLTLGAGYTIAIITESPLDAIGLFFIAVVLVIVGTYCLFVAGSIALLKLLCKNKGYYYQTGHFTAVSGMIYRMKQNAVGLANICILSTMVLVMVSTTVSLYVGVDDALKNRFPADIAITLLKPADGDMKIAIASAEAAAKKQNRIVSNLLNYNYLAFSAGRSGDAFTTDIENHTYDSKTSELCFLTVNEYERLGGSALKLDKNEVAVYDNRRQLGDSFTLMGKTYHVAERLESFPIEGDYSAMLMNFYYIIVSDETVFDDIYKGQTAAYGNRASTITGYIAFDLDGSKDQKIAAYKVIAQAVKSAVVKEGRPVSTECRQATESDFYAMYGGFLFLGLFLGLLFLMATVLIIYYKQISEGYDDKERFEIMQKVGMSRDEVRASINSQIIKVFFLPLVMAFIHIAAAFKMITKLLSVMNLSNIPLFALCTAATLLIFAGIYGIVYFMTAKVYYRIVS